MSVAEVFESNSKNSMASVIHEFHSLTKTDKMNLFLSRTTLNES